MTVRAFCLVVAFGITCEAFRLKEKQDTQKSLLQRVDLSSMTETKRAYTIWNALNHITKSGHMDDEAKGVALMEIMEDVERQGLNLTKPTRLLHCISDVASVLLQPWLAATNIRRLIQHAGTPVEEFAQGTESASMLSLSLSRGLKVTSDCGTYTRYNQMCAGSVSELGFNLLGATAAIASQVKKCVSTYNHTNEVIWGLTECQSSISKYVLNTISFLGQILRAIRKIRSGGERCNAEESLISGIFRTVQHFMFVAAAVVNGEACSTGKWGLHCAAESVETTAYVSGLGASIDNICDYCYPEPPDVSKCFFNRGWGYDKKDIRTAEGWAEKWKNHANLYLLDIFKYNNSGMIRAVDKLLMKNAEPDPPPRYAAESNEEASSSGIKLSDISVHVD